MYGKLAEILNTPEERLNALEEEMKKAGFEPALERVERENQELIDRVFGDIGVESKTAEGVRETLFGQIRIHEKELYRYLGISPENFDFEKIARAAEIMTTEDSGYFLKKEYAEEILRTRPPEDTMRYLGYSKVDEMLAKEDVGDVFSALRFTETDEWMHKTFDEAYAKFTPDDFEERKIELRVLGPQWKDVAEKYVAKKHHNVSHLKEFGILFLNPIAEAEEGKFLRDFALLLHYFHEIAFYSKLFRRYADSPDFSQRFISLLRGDVPERDIALPGEWLIVQKYLWKTNPEDSRLYTPHVNPEANHWGKALKDMIVFGENHKASGLEFWDELWAVAGIFENDRGERERISFELEDNAMGVASASDGKNETFSYHQHEALWNKIFAEYVGGYDTLEQYILDHMEKGKIVVGG